MIDVVHRLLDIEADLVVTITSPLDRRQPRNDQDRIRLRNLVGDARRQVLEAWDAKRAEPVLAHLDASATGLELGGGAHGLVIVATATAGEAQLLPFPVREAVTLATTPATRLLIQGLRDRLRRRRREVVDELTDALHSGKAVTGLDEVWQLGRQGRGRLIVVEEDYRAEPAREVDGRLVPVDRADRSAVLSDPVDEIIEHVVRLGGSAEFVEPDAMVELGRIGLLLR